MNKKRKTLSAREYLRQLEVLDMQISEDLIELSDLKDSAMSTGGIDYGRERIQTSAVSDRLCSDVVRYADFNERINKEVDRFVDAKRQIIREIRELRDKNYIQVLTKIYVQFKSVKTTSQEMKKSYNHVVNLHSKALKEFEKKHPNLYYLT